MQLNPAPENGLPIVIVGAGMAGFAVARELKARGVAEPVVLLTADEGAWYSKPLLSHSLSTNRPAESLLMTREKASATYSADIRPGFKVSGVNVSAKTVTSADGQAVSYSKLVIATGARAIQPWKGNRVFSVNSAKDFQALEPVLKNARNVLIAGAGFVGLEFANDWLRAGKSVTVASLDGPLANLVPQEVSTWIQARLERAGVRFVRGRVALQQISEESVEVALGDTLETFDLLVSAVGLTADVELWKQGGLLTGPHGVVVNERFQSSNPDIYAVGDAVEYQGRAWRFVAPMMHAAKVIADNLTGTVSRESFGALGINLKCPDAPITMSLPSPNAQGRWLVDSNSDFVDAKFSNGDSFEGFILGGVATAKRMSYQSELKLSA